MANFVRKILAPGARIRVLVVDDSVVIRRLVARALSNDPQIEVVGYAPNGEVALRRTSELKPDVITLDVEMPVMDGLVTLRQLRNIRAEPYVVMLSDVTEREALTAVDALSLGANDYLAKRSVGSLDDSVEKLRDELVPKIKQFFVLPPARSADGDRIERKITQDTVRLRYLSPRRVVAIGVSTGGPDALATVISMLPADFHLPILIVQHMPPVFTGLLAERLNSLTPLTVEEGAEGALIVPGKIYIAPGDHHMQLRRTANGDVAVQLTQDPPENSCRPAVDVLFRSVAEIYGGAVIAVILTGMGSDGARGAEALFAKGAHVIAQDEASSVVWGMPGAVVNAKLADTVVDLRSVVPEILRNV